MIKLKVSYEDPAELVEFVTFLGNKVIRLKTAKEQKGRYKRAYIDVNNKVLSCDLVNKKG